MKSLDAGHYVVRPFVTKKQWLIDVTSGSTGHVSIQHASYNTSSNYIELAADDDHARYNSISHLFGSGVGQSFYTNYAYANYDKVEFPLSESAYYILNFKQNKIGERIVPLSVQITATDSSTIYRDDGMGRLYASTGGLVGIIFYSLGIGIIKKNASSTTPTLIGSSQYWHSSYWTPSNWISGYWGGSLSSGSGSSSSGSGGGYYQSSYWTSANWNSAYWLLTSSGSGSLTPSDTLSSYGIYLTDTSQLQVGYKSKLTIYETTAICSVAPTEFNYSTNPSLQRPTISGTYNGSSFVQQTGSVGIQLMYSGTLSPYFTTIGLFNDIGEMVAVAKLSTPIKRTSHIQQTVIVRLDI